MQVVSPDFFSIIIAVMELLRKLAVIPDLVLQLIAAASGSSTEHSMDRLLN